MCNGCPSWGKPFFWLVGLAASEEGFLFLQCLTLFRQVGVAVVMFGLYAC